MKKIISLITAAALSLTLLSGCSGGANSSDNENLSGKLKIYTSFYPMYDFAKRVGGDKVELTNLVPAGTEPHDWEPSTTDIKNLEAADMLIYSGAGMEHWVDKVIDSLENKDLVTLEASENVTLIEGHHEEEASEEEKASAYDPHVWMSIKSAKIEMEAIKNALVKLDNTNAEYYEENFKTNAAKFDELDKVYADTLSALTNKDIIVAHDAFAYLCADYGLNQVPIEGLSADSEPDPAKMSEIIDFAKKHNVKTIFFEELVSPKVAETIASELGAKTDMLNPLEGLTDEQLSAGEDYLSVMSENLDALKKALE